MKQILSIVILATLTAAASAQAKPQPSDGVILTEASLSVAKRVCAAKPDSSVWIYRGDWVILGCSQLGEVFALDTDNSFDAIIPLMQSIHDETPKKAEGK